jgi:hypothetical protein
MIDEVLLKCKGKFVQTNSFHLIVVLCICLFSTPISASEEIIDTARGNFGPTFSFSVGTHNSNYGDNFKLYKSQATGVSFEIEMQNDGFGISAYYSPATIKSDKEFVVWDDTIKNNQKFNAWHSGVAFNIYSKPIYKMFLLSISLGYEWFSFSSPNLDTNANFHHISTPITSGATLGFGAAAYHTFSKHFTIEIHPYLRYSLQDYRLYNKSLNNGSMQIGTLVTFLGHL